MRPQLTSKHLAEKSMGTGTRKTLGKNKGTNTEKIKGPAQYTALQPKKVSVPFMYFVKEHSKQVMFKHKQRNVAGAVKLLAQDWKKMTEEEKSKYTELSAADRKRHQEQSSR